MAVPQYLGQRTRGLCLGGYNFRNNSPAQNKRNLINRSDSQELYYDDNNNVIWDANEDEKKSARNESQSWSQWNPGNLKGLNDMSHNMSGLSAATGAVIKSKQEIMEFYNEGETISSSALLGQTPIPSKLQNMTMINDHNHDVRTFLARPIPVYQGLWNTTDSGGTILYQANFPEEIISNFPMYRMKMEGFLGLSADMEIRVQVNSQQFQQGRLIVGYVPYGQYIPNKLASVLTTLTGATGCPHVDLDLSTSTEMSLTMPYISPHAYYNLVTGQGSFGHLFVMVYGALHSLDASPVAFTVFANFKNVKMVTPTGAPVYTGSSPNKIHLMDAISKGDFIRAKQIMSGDLDNRIENAVFAQGDVVVQGADEDTTIKEKGVVEDVAASVGNVGRSLERTNVPVLSQIGTGVKEVGNFVSGIAKWFGFSKPTNKGAICHAKLGAAKYMTNYNGEDQSHPLGLSSTNKLSLEACAGSNRDEMSIAYIARTPNFVGSFIWNTTHVVGTILNTFILNPTQYEGTLSTPTTVVISHLGFIARSFAQWRGSLVFTFKIVKTTFHSGRLRFIYAPGSYGAIGTVDINQCETKIIDIRSQSETTMTCPYRASTPWLYTQYSPGSGQYNGSIGTLYVQVLNELRATTTVDDEVEILVEISGGEDIKFNIPQDPDIYAWDGVVPPPKSEIVVQGSDLTRPDFQDGATPNSFDSNSVVGVDPDLWTVGEAITSIRQILKRFCNTATVYKNYDATPLQRRGWIPGFSDYSVLAIKPYVMSRALPAPSNPIDEIPELRVDYLDYYSIPFVFARGAMRFKFEVENGFDQSGSNRFYYSFNWLRFKLFNNWGRFNYPDLSVARWTSAAHSNGKVAVIDNTQNTTDGLTYLNLVRTSHAVVAQNIEGMSEVEVPFYCKGHMIPIDIPNNTALAMQFPDIERGIFPSSCLTMMSTECNAAQFQYPLDVQVYRATGDDFSLMTLIGMPVMMTTIGRTGQNVNL